MSATQLRKASLLLPFFLLSGVLLIGVQSTWMNNPRMDLAISIDLLVLVPLSWFLLIRKREIPNITVVPITVLSLILGFVLLRPEDQTYLHYFESFVLPFVELGVVGFILWKVVQIRKALKANADTTSDFFDSLLMAVSDILPRPVVRPFALEIAVFYYAFRFKKAKPIEGSFTYHRESGVTALYGALVFIILVETAVLHILLERWSPLTAWILTGISLYTAIQFLAYARSLSARPIRLHNNSVKLNYGIVASAEVDIQNIERIETTSSDLPEDGSVVKLGLLGALESHNVILHFAEPVEMIRLYGTRVSTTAIALYLDKPDEFKAAISS
ncbi:hypothetical protein [Phaeocystidibacter luteus]|uniref:Uncharacterized protein n=1 Tax=Phaeocystidibacter luteus TaxID=911197 RepID=A0A6N6RKI0_9FLAO|nr:hypothetical protein [Phaeocystidibacter luteus]KAB2810175.1 hypothetical protein F8C67_08045 [Phaeocystidibacter luteus]